MQTYRIITSRGVGCGFFSHFFQVLGQLIECEEQAAVPIVFFRRNFAYWEAGGSMRSDNPWEYYFYPVSEASLNGVLGMDHEEFLACGLYDFSRASIMGYTRDDERRISTRADVLKVPEDITISNEYPYRRGRPLISFRRVREAERHTINDLIGRFIRIKPHVLSTVESFCEQHFRSHMVALHIRGQEHAFEINAAGFELAPPCAYFALVDDYLAQHPGAGVLVCTESEEVARCAAAHYGERLVKYPARLAPEGSAPHKLFGGYQVGLDVLVECLLMARCDYMVHGISEVPFASLYFAPDLPHVDIYRIAA